MKEADYLLIEKYLDGGLSSSERADFEARLKQDEALKAELELRRQMDAFPAAQSQDLAFLKTLKEQNAKHFGNGEATIRKINNRNRVIVLVSSVAAAVITFLLISRAFAPDSSLYERYNSHQNVALSLRGEENILGQIERAFNSQDYQEAYNLSETYLRGDTIDLQIQEVQGRAALALEKFAEAENIFKEISEGTSLYKDNGYWYLGLTYLKQDKKDSAKAAFQNVGKEAGKIYRQAQEIIPQLP